MSQQIIEGLYVLMCVQSQQQMENNTHVWRYVYIRAYDTNKSEGLLLLVAML